MRKRYGAGALLAGACAVAGIAVGQPPWLAPLLVRLTPRWGLVFAARTARPAVALTFDDGPHPVVTPDLLRVLAEHDAQATFFFIGSRVQDFPGVVSDALAAGHEIGNHLWQDRPSALLALPAFETSLEQTQSALLRLGARPGYVRPASGWFRPSQLAAARRRGYVVVLGSVAVRDLGVPDVDAALRFVLRRIRPGSVVVLHEGVEERRRVVALTDRLLTELAGRGYRCTSLSDLLDAGQGARGG